MSPISIMTVHLVFSKFLATGKTIIPYLRKHNNNVNFVFLYLSTLPVSVFKSRYGILSHNFRTHSLLYIVKGLIVSSSLFVLSINEFMFTYSSSSSSSRNGVMSALVSYLTAICRDLRGANTETAS